MRGGFALFENLYFRKEICAQRPQAVGRLSSQVQHFLEIKSKGER